RARAERLELGAVVTTAHVELGITLARAGRVAESERVLLSAAMGDSADVSSRAYSQLYVAQMLLHKELPAEALSAVESALAVVGASSFPGEYAFALAVRGQALLALSRPDEALRCTRRGMQILAQLGHMFEGERLLRLIHARALRADGHRGEAERAISDARALVHAQAETIAKPDWRRTFLGAVAENRLILELAETWPRASAG
ncbi:MAG: hypothetical protein AAGC55_20865, partial [Myxococcota bacterium]